MVTLNNWEVVYIFLRNTKIPTNEVQPNYYPLLLLPEVKIKPKASEHISTEEVGKKIEKRLTWRQGLVALKNGAQNLPSGRKRKAVLNFLIWS